MDTPPQDAVDKISKANWERAHETESLVPIEGLR
jgi:hypothetical protein